jgi:hypothetical protein
MDTEGQDPLRPDAARETYKGPPPVIPKGSQQVPAGEWTKLTQKFSQLGIPSKLDGVTGNTKGLELFSITDPDPSGRRSMLVPADPSATLDNELGRLIFAFTQAMSMDLAIAPPDKVFTLPDAYNRAGKLKAFLLGITQVLLLNEVPQYDPSSGAFGQGTKWCAYHVFKAHGCKNLEHTFASEVSVSKILMSAGIAVGTPLFTTLVQKILPKVRDKVAQCALPVSSCPSWCRSFEDLQTRGVSVKTKAVFPPCQLSCERLWAASLGVMEAKAIENLLRADRNAGWIKSFWFEYTKLKSELVKSVQPAITLNDARRTLVFRKDAMKMIQKNKGFVLEDLLDKVDEIDAANIVLVPYYQRIDPSRYLGKQDDLYSAIRNKLKAANHSIGEEVYDVVKGYLDGEFGALNEQAARKKRKAAPNADMET